MRVLPAAHAEAIYAALVSRRVQAQEYAIRRTETSIDQPTQVYTLEMQAEQKSDEEQ